MPPICKLVMVKAMEGPGPSVLTAFTHEPELLRYAMLTLNCFSLTPSSATSLRASHQWPFRVTASPARFDSTLSKNLGTSPGHRQ